jgi:pyruvate dehydrogenase E2 component (dihydrolipoamide acetyltransferase)
LKLLYNSGDDVPVLKPIAVIGAANEDWQAALGGVISTEASHGGTEAQKEKEKIIARESSSPLNSSVNSVSPVPSREDSRAIVSGISPRARNLADKEALPLETVSGTGPGGRIIERDVAAALQDRPPLTAAAKAAGVAGVLQAGSGIGGRVTATDLAAEAVLAAEAALPTKAGIAVSPNPQFSNEGAITETPIKGIRKVIASRMFKSLSESAQFTLNASAPAAKLQEIRSRIKTQADFAGELGLSKITINDLVLFAVSRTLPLFPFMNAHKTGETIRIFERVHLAVAVDTQRGLMVPVIRNANLLSPAQISSEAKRLATACQNGTANPDELSGSTFTVSNLGSFGVTSFTPVLNAPEVAILGVCGIEMKPVAIAEGETDECGCGVRFEPQIGFSLTINHQAVDGAPAARFLKALAEAVAHIDLLLAAG